MEYIDNCLYNGEELPKLPENMPYAGSIIVYLGNQYMLVSTNTVPMVSGTDVTWGDNNLSVGYELTGGEWVAGASGSGSVGSIAGGYFLWTNNTIYDSDGSVHLAATPIVRISTDTEEINAGVSKYYNFTFQDGDGNTLADPKATYDLLITNDTTGAILTEADWINVSSFPKVYIYNTSPEHHTVRIMMTWEGTDGLKYRGYKYIVIGEAMAVEPDPEPEEPVVQFKLDLKSFLTGLAIGLSGKPLPLTKPTSNPVAYLYNGVRLPKLPEWDMEMYPYAVMTGTADDGFTLRIAKCFEYDKSDFAEYVDFPVGTLRYETDWEPTPLGGTPHVPTRWEVDDLFVGRETTVYFHKIVWANFDIVCQTDIYKPTGEIYLAASDPIPVYE